MDIKSLPILKDFKNLKQGDRVYTDAYGIGVVESLYYSDEAIISFSSVKKRISIYDNVKKVPGEYVRNKISSKVEIFSNGEKITFKELKRRNALDKKRIEVEKQILRDKKKR